MSKNEAEDKCTSFAVWTEKLSKVYGDGVTRVKALHEVSVGIDSGKFTAIMGPSGSGKSTLMHCLAGLDTATAGSIYMGEQNLAKLNDTQLTKLRRSQVGFVFQTFNLIPTLNAKENITLPLDIAGGRVDWEWFDKVVTTLELGDRLLHKPSELSGGQQQRVACARALVSRPRVVFADEPSGNLDSVSGGELLGFLKQSVTLYKQTVVMVTHDAVAAAYADKVLFLQDGQIVSDMFYPTPEKILNKLAGLSVKAGE